MRLILALIPALFVISCGPAPKTSGDAICDGTRALRTAHAAALAETEDERALETGAALIVAIDAGCR